MSDAADDFMGGDIESPFPPRRGRPGLTGERAKIIRDLRTAQNEMRKAQDRLAELNAAASRFGPEPPVGTVITFTKRFPGSLKTYSYAALRVGPERAVGGGWFLTGRDGKRPQTWAWLCDFIGDGPFRVIEPDDSTARFLGGKSKFFNVVVNEHMPSDMVLMFDEAGEVLRVGVDPAFGRADELADLIANKKIALSAVTKRPGDEFPSTKAAAPGEAGYDPDKFANATLAKLALPFEAVARSRELVGGGKHVTWVVRDRRIFTSRNEGIVAEFPAAKNGEMRARQSAADRNRPIWAEMLTLKSEPPVGARVRSKSTPRRWAVRKADGWMRYNGTVVQGVRLNWDTVRMQLAGRLSSQWIEPGTHDSTELFG